MGFFKDLKEDFSQAMSELMPDEEFLLHDSPEDITEEKENQTLEDKKKKTSMKEAEKGKRESKNRNELQYILEEELKTAISVSETSETGIEEVEDAKDYESYQTGFLDELSNDDLIKQTQNMFEGLFDQEDEYEEYIDPDPFPALTNVTPNKQSTNKKQDSKKWGKQQELEQEVKAKIDALWVEDEKENEWFKKNEEDANSDSLFYDSFPEKNEEELVTKPEFEQTDAVIDIADFLNMESQALNEPSQDSMNSEEEIISIETAHPEEDLADQEESKSLQPIEMQSIPELEAVQEEPLPEEPMKELETEEVEFIEELDNTPLDIEITPDDKEELTYPMDLSNENNSQEPNLESFDRGGDLTIDATEIPEESIENWETDADIFQDKPEEAYLDEWSGESGFINPEPDAALLATQDISDKIKEVMQAANTAILTEQTKDEHSEIKMEEDTMNNLEEAVMNGSDTSDMDLIAQLMGEDNEPVALIDEDILSINDNNLEEIAYSNPLETSFVDHAKDITVITKGTTISGNISSDGSLEIMGTINGDIDCLGKLSVMGSVLGNSSASEIYINAARLEGGIKSSGTVKIGEGSIVIGDVKASSAVVAGAVKGGLDVDGPVVIDSTAIVKGNINARSVQINNGAVTDGYCSLTYASVDMDSFFDSKKDNTAKQEEKKTEVKKEESKKETKKNGEK